MPPFSFFMPTLAAAIATTAMTNLTTTGTTSVATTSVPEVFDMTTGGTMAAHMTTTRKATVTIPLHGPATASYQTSIDTITTLENYATESTMAYTDESDDPKKEKLLQGQPQMFMAQTDPLKQFQEQESNVTTEKVDESKMTFRPPTLNSSLAEESLENKRTTAPPHREEGKVDRSFETVHTEASPVSSSQSFDALVIDSDGFRGDEEEAHRGDERNDLSWRLAQFIDEAGKMLERSSAVLGKTNSTHATQIPRKKATEGQEPGCGQRPQLEYLVMLIGPLVALLIVVASGTGCFCLYQCLKRSTLQEQGRQQATTYQSSGRLSPGGESRQDDLEDPACILCRREPCRASTHRRTRDGRVAFGMTQEENPAKRSLPSVPAGMSTLLASMSQIPPPEVNQHGSQTTTITVDVDQVKQLNSGSGGSPSYKESMELELRGRESASTLRNLGKIDPKEMGNQEKEEMVDPCAIYSNVPTKKVR